MSEEYNRSSVGPCRKCGCKDFYEIMKNHQCVAKCVECDAYIKNVPKVHKEIVRKPQAHLKAALLERQDDSCPFCELCLRTEDELMRMTRTGLFVHHVLEVHMGGSDELHNLQLLCHSCHEIVHRVREISIPRIIH